jgi:hypothetical protein
MNLLKKREDLEHIGKQYEQYKNINDNKGNKEYYEEKVAVKNDLMKQKEKEHNDLMEALNMQNSDAKSDAPSIARPVMAPPNFEYLHRQRQYTALKDKAAVGKIKVNTSIDTVSTKSEIKYNENIKDIVGNDNLSKGGSNYSSESQRRARGKPIIIG